jgi:hypothetical protein
MTGTEYTTSFTDRPAADRHEPAASLDAAQ